jgi:hypothetical protein
VQEVHKLYLVTEALALRAEADGDFAHAAALMSGWLTSVPGLGYRDLRYLVYLALAAGDPDTARAAVAAAQAEAAADGSPGRVIAARFCEALVSDDSAGLLAIAEDCQGHGWRLIRASAR